MIYIDYIENKISNMNEYTVKSKVFCFFNFIFYVFVAFLKIGVKKSYFLSKKSKIENYKRGKVI